MAFFDPETGALRFADGPTFRAGMTYADVLAACDAPAAKTATSEEAFLPFPAYRVPGGRVAPVCVLRGGALHAVELHVAAVGQREQPGPDLARALLFGLAHCKDPAPDSRAPVLLQCAFGALLVATDPHSGRSVLRVTYRAPA